jgi:hypothetical protein
VYAASADVGVLQVRTVTSADVGVLQVRTVTSAAMPEALWQCRFVGVWRERCAKHASSNNTSSSCFY